MLANKEKQSWRNYEKLTSRELKLVNDAINWNLDVKSVAKAKQVLETANKLQSWNAEYVKIGDNTYRTFDIVTALDQSVVNYYEITKHKTSVKKLLEKNIDETEKDAIPELAEILKEQEEKINKVVRETQDRIVSYRKKNFKERKTAQIVSQLTGTFGEKLGLKEIREEINIKSFAEIISKMNYQELKEFYLKIREISDRNNRDGDVYKYNIFNIGELKKLFREKWYKPNGAFWWEEMWALVTLIESYYLTQKALSNMKLEDAFTLMLDFDKDGYLSTWKEIVIHSTGWRFGTPEYPIDKKHNENNFYVGEMQMYFETFKSLTSDWVKALIKNLGLGSVKSFLAEMKNNLFVAREKFKRALAIAIERWISPSELVKKGGVEKANKEIYKNQEKITEKVSKEVDKFVKSKLWNIADKDAVKALKLAAVWVMFGWNTWAWASFDIKKMNAFFDSVQLWVVNWTPGISVSKNLLKKNGFNVNWTQANLFIPILTVSKTIEHDPKLKKLFSDDIKWGVDVSLFASIAPAAKVFGVVFEKVDENTEKWIERMVQKMNWTLKRIINDIRNGKGFENSSYYSLSQDKVADRKVYEEIRAFYLTYAKGRSYEKAIMEDYKNAYLSYYRSKLYSEAEWTNVTTIGWGLALLAWFLPIPYILIGWEHISQNWKEVIHNVNRQEKVTYTSAEELKKKFNIEEVTYKGVKALKIPNKEYDFNVSAPGGVAEVERKWDFIYIAWNIHNIKINQFTDATWVINTIVINGWEKNKDGLYIPVRKEEPIRTSIKMLEEKREELTRKNIEALKNTQELRDWLFKVIWPDTLTHRKTPGMMKLQRMIFNLQNGRKGYTIEKAWKQFEYAFGNNTFMEYLAEKGIYEIPAFRAETDEEKMLVLQAVNANFMKKTRLQDTDKDGKINVGNNETIREYDARFRRDIYFNRLFAKKFPHLLPQIKKARQEWYEANADAKQYTFKPIVDGSIAFTGVESKYRGRSNIKGIMPYVGAYNIASIDGWKDFIDIDGKSPEVIRALPKTFLRQLRKILNENGVKVRTLQGVINFINKWWNDKVKIDYHLAFAKMGECLNDAVILKDMILTIQGKKIQIWATSVSAVYSPDPSVVKWGVVWTGKKRVKTEDNEGEVKTTPKDEDAENVNENNKNPVEGETQVPVEWGKKVNDNPANIN